jgi:type IV secretory pathway VirB9-like protein
MLRILQKRSEIDDAQEAFKKQFESVGELRKTRVGYPGVSRESRVCNIYLDRDRKHMGLF